MSRETYLQFQKKNKKTLFLSLLIFRRFSQIGVASRLEVVDLKQSTPFKRGATPVGI